MRTPGPNLADNLSSNTVLETMHIMLFNILYGQFEPLDVCSPNIEISNQSQYHFRCAI